MSVVTYDDYLKGAQPNVKDFCKEALVERDKFLTEYVDKIKDKLTRDDILSQVESDDNRVIITCAPGSGKTTAMRQYIVKSSHVDYGLVSMFRVDDLEVLYYDVYSQLYTRGKLDKISIKLYTGSDYPDNLIDTLRRTNWIFCTHQRLLIEPASIVYYVSAGLDSMYTPRDVAFIDELPASMYIKNRFHAMIQLMVIKGYICKLYNKDPKKVNKAKLSMMVQDMIINKPEKDLENILIILDCLPKLGSSCRDVIQARDNHRINGSRLQIEALRITNLLQFFTDKVVSYYHNTSLSDQVFVNKTIYYSIIDLDCSNIIIFDGTSDIIMKDTGWKLIEVGTKRHIKLDSVTRVVDGVSRYRDTTKEIIKSYCSLIEKVYNENKEKGILVYLWKTKKYRTRYVEDDLVPGIKNELKTNGILDYVDLVTYNSGKERSTNEFRSDSVVLILGTFYLPDEAIADIINCNKPSKNNNTTTEEYTLSLITQLLYRTKARTGEPIKMYIDDGYDDKMVKKLLKLSGSEKTCLSEKKLYSDVIPSKSRKDYHSSLLDKSLGTSMNCTTEYEELKEMMKIRKNLSIKELMSQVQETGFKIKITQKGSKAGQHGVVTKFLVSRK